MLDNVHRHGLTEQDQANLLKAIGMFVRQSILIAIEPRDQMIAELTKRVEMLESAGIKFAGSYQRSLCYDKGDVAQCDGSLWIALCRVPPMEQPGKSQMWQLAVKSPRWPTQSRSASGIVERRNGG